MTTASFTESPPDHDEIARRYDELVRRHTVEMRCSEAAADGAGIAGLVQALAALTSNPLWLIDSRHRVVARSVRARGSDFRQPDLSLLLERHGPVDLAAPEPLLVSPEPSRGVTRRYLVMAVARAGCLFSWLVMGEVSARLRREDAHLVARGAFHLASEYVVQRRVARASWNARAALARQLVRGSGRDDDLRTAAEYLGVRADADRVLVYIADRADSADSADSEDGVDVDDDPRDDEVLCGLVARELSVEVLATRGREGAILLVEAPRGSAHVSFVQDVKEAMRRCLATSAQCDVIAGISSVTGPAGLRRSYREAREVVQCIDRFAGATDRIIAVDDLGPARLFVANSDVGAVRRYVRDVLGALLDETPGRAELIRTLHCFFDTGRSVRGSAVRLGIHENTVRLRLAKVHQLTGLDVAGDANDQLSVQTALLVLRLEGHSSVRSFDDRDTDRHVIGAQETA